jgi:hypothetical protein
LSLRVALLFRRLRDASAALLFSSMSLVAILFLTAGILGMPANFLT